MKSPPSHDIVRPRRRIPTFDSPRLWGGLASWFLLASCTANLGGMSDDGASVGGGPSAGTGASGPISGTGSSTGMPGGGGPGAGGGSGGPVDCAAQPSVAVAARRIVRLSFNQVANSIATLVDRALGTTIVTEFELVDAEHRAFPPLQSAREGNSFTDDSWSAVDQIAQTAGEYVLNHLDEVTGCGAAPTDECAQSYLRGLAKKAYRRPLTEAESARLDALYTTDFKGAGASVTEALQHGVYAIFQSPHFLYRTELGSTTSGETLSQLEMASILSYFLTDDTPDAELLAAAESGALANESQVEAQIDRILQTDAAKVNLKGAMMSYFAYPNLETQVIQDDDFTGDMRRSMYHEAELFLDNALWSGPLNQLLISKKGYVDARLAPLYGFASFPPAGATPLADSFYEVDLPSNRTGLLTQAGFLANRSRPDHTSVVGRGLLIKGAFLCTETPAPDASVTNIINQLAQTMPDASEREMADLRAESPVCAECHSTFDAYGLALDTYDVLGRYRDVDDHGRPIDPSATLPAVLGGGEAQNILEVANKLAESGAFARCMGQNLINYALSDVSAGAANISSCAVDRVANAFAASDGTFLGLVKAVAMSEALSKRSQAAATQGESQ